jgi:hypothetical protein
MRKKLLLAGVAVLFLAIGQRTLQIKIYCFCLLLEMMVGAT